MAMCDLPRPVWPKNTRSSQDPMKARDSMSSLPQPSGKRTWVQSKPSTDLWTGSLACLSSLARLLASRWATSASSMALHPATWVGVDVSRNWSITSFEM